MIALQLQRTSETKKLYMPFYKLYTPNAIRTEAEFTTSYYNYSSTAITFSPSSSSYRRLFKLPLIGGSVLNRYADITVKITVGLQNAIRTYDSDPKFFISDGERGIGFEMREEAVRCQGIEGMMNDRLTTYSTRGGASHESSILPEQFVIILATNQHWGSCYFAVDSGLISPVSYTYTLYLDQGLSLEVYAENVNERYLFNYIIVEIHEN